MRSPPGTSLQPASSRASTGCISDRWLPFARGVWVVCALLLLANFVASIPAYYQLLNTVSTLPDPSNCAMGLLTPGNAQVLAILHLSLSDYAAFFVMLEVTLSMLPWDSDSHDFITGKATCASSGRYTWRFGIDSVSQKTEKCTAGYSIRHALNACCKGGTTKSS